MKILFVGDVCGEMGKNALKKYLPIVKREHNINLTFVNGENAAQGLGITEKIYKEFMALGVNVVTMGNHTFSKKEINQFIDNANMVRPANYHDSVPGKGYIIINYNSIKVAVVNMMGRVFFKEQLDNPFHKMDELLEEIEADYIIVDFHAEATSEKIAFARYLDGRVTAVVGTHTHVPTADNIILPKNTMYISDVGMTGALYGVLGVKLEQPLNTFLTGVSSRMMQETDGPMQFNAVVIDTDKGKIERINIFEK